MSRILLIEDEKSLAGAVRRGLIAEGFAVDLAFDGVEGQWMAEQNPYDAVILDIMLPERDGYEVCGNLRAAGQWMPILMLTARDGARDEIRSLDTGADDYLAKPFSFQVLLARIRALLRRPRGERPSVLRLHDLTLDPAAHRVQRGDIEIELTSREFAVLEALMRRKGDVISKLEILDHVWDFAFEGDPNIVEVYVRRLRRKVDEPFGRKTIETVRGAGYRVAASPH
ncbi:MAG: winged helix-turn-helix domain-containing protein [Tepidiformaceae bacterium]